MYSVKLRSSLRSRSDRDNLIFKCAESKKGHYSSPISWGLRQSSGASHATSRVCRIQSRNAGSKFQRNIESKLSRFSAETAAKWASISRTVPRWCCSVSVTIDMKGLNRAFPTDRPGAKEHLSTFKNRVFFCKQQYWEMEIVWCRIGQKIRGAILQAPFRQSNDKDSGHLEHICALVQ